MSAPRRFLLALWDGGGNVPPAMGLVRRLVERGHRVRILGDPTLAEEARVAGAEHVPWRAAPHRRSRRPEDDVFRDYEIRNPLGMVRECRIPLLLLVTMRGEYGEFNPWQVPMGQATPDVLRAMGVTVQTAGAAEDVAAITDAVSLSSTCVQAARYCARRMDAHGINRPSDTMIATVLLR